MLHLETSTKICSVALSQDGILLAHNDQTGDGYIHGEALTLMIEALLQNAHKTLQDIKAISFSSGPGSYTGLRIGLSTAKGLCYALSIPIIAIPTHQILFQMAMQFGSEGPQNTIALLDARRTEVYMEVFDAQGKSIQPSWLVFECLTVTVFSSLSKWITTKIEIEKADPFPINYYPKVSSPSGSTAKACADDHLDPTEQSNHFDTFAF